MDQRSDGRASAQRWVAGAQVPRHGKYQPVKPTKAWSQYKGTVLGSMSGAYFSYEVENHGPYATVRAVADFNSGGPMHLSEVVVQVTPSQGRCEAKIRHFNTRNFLE